MLAKLFPRLSRDPQARRFVHQARRGASVLALAASLAALVLILGDRYPGYFPKNFDSQAARLDQSEPNQGTTGIIRVPPGAAGTQDHRHHVLAEFLARKYSVSRDVTGDLVQIAYSAGHRLGVDPLLIIAVMAIESGLNPIAESVSGAKGLMQVIPRYHPEKFEEFGGEKAVFDPQVNILIGSKILKEYITRSGNLKVALQMYAGAVNDNQDLYTTRVLNEKLRLQRIIAQNPPRAMRTNSRGAEKASTESSAL